jgi:hypothetical protein
MRDWEWTFECFDIVELHELSSFHSWYGTIDVYGVTQLNPLGLQSISGHLAMFAQEAVTPDDQHDVEFGDGDGSRNRGAHGWIVQNAENGSDPVVVPEHQPIPGAREVGIQQSSDVAAWARPLAQSNTALTGEEPTENPTLKVETDLP